MSTQPNAEQANEKQRLLAHLRESRDRYLQAVGLVPEELSRVKPAQDCWSVLECAEHVAVAEQLMFRSFEKRRPSGEPPNHEKDAVIKTGLLDRTRKRRAPEPAQPAGKFPSLAHAVAEFKAARERTLAHLEQNSEDLRKCSVMHPLVGLIDGYQALSIIALHAERHALQMEEIMKCPAYQAQVK
jgi:DinB superfamily